MTSTACVKTWTPGLPKKRLGQVTDGSETTDWEDEERAPDGDALGRLVEGSARIACLDDHGGARKTSHHAIPFWEVGGGGLGTDGKGREKEVTLGDQRLELGILFRVGLVEGRADDADGPAAVFDG
jgi:hypothetical protein